MGRTTAFLTLALLGATAAPVSAQDNARIVASTIPAVMTPNQRVQVRVVVLNTGASTWRAGAHRLGAVDDSDPLQATGRIDLAQGQRVGPFRAHAFTFELTAPAAPGAYVTDWRMVHEHVRWFGTTLRRTVRVVAPPQGDGAQVVGHTLPDTLVAGQTVQATVTMRNTGTSTWDRAFKLGANGDDDPLRAGMDVREWLPQGTTVAPGADHTFTFTVTLLAPQQPGQYLTDWRMVHEGVQWFGPVVSKTVMVDPRPAVVRRSGRVRLQGNALVDDQGAFNALGATLFWGLWGYMHDRPKLERALDYLSQQGFDYVRCLGVVGDPAGPDSWDGREIAWRAAGYQQAIAGLTDLAFDRYGLRLEWTLIGDGQVSIPDRNDRFTLADWFLAMSRGREEKIMHFEVANEYWQNGFAGQAGEDQLRELTRYLNDRTDVLVAASAAGGADVERVYAGGIADLCTQHFDRDIQTTEREWRPVRQPWEHQFLRDVPVGSNNEPIGPGSSVNTDRDPMRLVMGAVISHVCGLPLHVFHSGAGVRGRPQDGELWDMPGTNQVAAMKAYVPGDLGNWSRQNAHWATAPFRPFARDAAGNLHADLMWPDLGGGAEGAVRVYGAIKGDQFFVAPIGVQGRLLLEPRRAVELDVLEPLTGGVLQHLVLDAGERFELSGGTAFILKGRFR
jgi:hypothetical protein